MYLSAEQRVHRTALALNNQAITLLQQGQYASAKSALSQSLSIMETLILNLGDEEDEEDASSVLLMRSLEYASNTTTQKSTQPREPGNMGIEAMRISPFEIYPVEDNDFCNIRASLQYGYSPTVYFPILMRGEDELETLEVMVISRQYALVLYNTAITYIICQEHSDLCQRHCRNHNMCIPQEGKTQDSFQIAARLLTSSDSVLSSVVLEMAKQEESKSGTKVDHVARVQLMLVSGLVLNSLSFSLLECRQEMQASLALQAVDNLTAVLDQYSSLFVPVSISPAA